MYYSYQKIYIITEEILAKKDKDREKQRIN